MKLKFVAALLAGSAFCFSAPALRRRTRAAAARSRRSRMQSDADGRCRHRQRPGGRRCPGQDRAAAGAGRGAPGLDRAGQSRRWSRRRRHGRARPQWDDKDAGFSFKPKGLDPVSMRAISASRDGNELRGTRRRSQLRQPRLEQPRPPPDDRRRRHAARRLPLQRRIQLRAGHASITRTSCSPTTSRIRRCTVQVGNFYPFSSLETMTSSKFTSFLERASFTDAFNYNRRLGIGLHSPTTRRPTAGRSRPAFSTSRSTTATSPAPAGRPRSAASISPMLGSTRLHLGANFQHRENNREALGAQLSDPAADADHRSALHRHRQYRGQGRRYRRRRSSRRS